MERQGNRLFCSSEETAYWENKTNMHRKLAEIGVPTPRTKIVTGENRQSVAFDIEPALIKEEHSAGSSGIHYFATAGDARNFVMNYSFRPTESLIMQEVVAGATKDMRLTMVGDKAIELCDILARENGRGAVELQLDIDRDDIRFRRPPWRHPGPRVVPMAAEIFAKTRNPYGRHRPDVGRR